MNFVKLNVDGSNQLVADKLMFSVHGEVLFMSLIGYKSNIDRFIYQMFQEKGSSNIVIRDRNTDEYISSIYTSMHKKDYDYITKKMTNNDYVHMILHKKDEVQEDNFKAYIYQRTDETEEDLQDKIYKTIDKYLSVPMLKEWMPEIYKELVTNTRSKYHYSVIEEPATSRYAYNSRAQFQAEENMRIYELIVRENDLIDIISEKLKDHTINIEGCTEESNFLETCNGLDSYLDIFGEALAEKIQRNFSPKFTPNVDKYDYYTNVCDDYIHAQGIELYEAQKAVSQAIVNNWRINDNTLLVGECGAGKTIISSLAVYAHHANSRKGFNAIVMCPSHIVEKWKREVEMAIPNTRAYIIHNLDELLDIKPMLENKYRTVNMFIILSKEVAKFSYDERPAAVWSNTHNTFICPECGKRLYKIGKKKHRFDKIEEIPLTEIDFSQKYEYNQKCPKCKSKLWTALNRDEENSKWIKLGKNGWIQTQHIEKVLEELLEKTSMTKKERELFDALNKAIDYNDEHDEWKITYKGSKKYSVAKYIKHKMKGIFDYGIIDELHSLSSKDSIQGQAFHYITQACKKNIAMTGTLINGYADSIYYILYRLFPRLMKRNGFEYQNVSDFIEKYGVLSYSWAINSNTRNKKKLPGVSPLIFTDYLSNNTVFISLKDMKDELPTYREIPMGVNMNQDVEQRYNEYQDFMINLINENRMSRGTDERPSLKILGSLVKEMLNYPDAPHCAESIKDPDTGQIKFIPTKLEYETREKEDTLLDIVREKVENGEKVLVYYNAVNKTDIGQKLVELLEENDFKAFELKANTKSEKRESIIKKKIEEGLDVLICNPSLVETGLDLIDFTTIVFYQVGYNLYTMRQASRRSWRLSQKNPVTVYYLYYNNTVQAKALSLMATKLHAAKSMEGDFDEEGLKSMSENTDILTQIANNVVNGISDAVDNSLFESTNFVREAANKVREHKLTKEDIEIKTDNRGMRVIVNEYFKHTHNTELDNKALLNPLNLFI